MKNLTRLFLELVAFAALGFGVFTVSTSWSALPDVVPIHFGLGGQADGFGNKMWIPGLTAVAGFMYLLLTISKYFPHRSNTPWKITEENRERQYDLIRALLTWLKAETMVMFAYIQWAMIEVAMGRAHGLSPWFGPVWIGVIFVTIGLYFYRGYKAR